jgi:amino acid permease
MNTNPKIRRKIIEALLRQRDDKKRRKIMMTYVGVFLLCTGIINGFYYADIPLHAFIETFCCVIIAYTLFMIAVLYRFPLVAEFIDWREVEAAKEEEKA